MDTYNTWKRQHEAIWNQFRYSYIKRYSANNEEDSQRDLCHLRMKQKNNNPSVDVFETTLYSPSISTSRVPLKSWVLPRGTCIFDGGSSGK